jgi:hypothetical protein
MSNIDEVDIDSVDDKSFIVNMIIDGKHYHGDVTLVEEDNE